MQAVIDLADDAATRQLGEDLALALKPGDVLALSGDLGTGKSTLARALIRALADDPDLDVPSPTFTLVQAYPGRLPVAHFDFYRLSSAEELEELGFGEAVEDGIAVVEWPERMDEALPAGRIRLRLTHVGGGRRATINADGKVAERVQRTLLIRRFLGRCGLEERPRRYLTGDASIRAYEYLPQDDGTRLILMDWPKPPEGPPVHDGKPYAKVAHIAENAWPFIALAQTLAARGLAVPEILHADCDNGILLLGDLGREGILDPDGRPIEERYRKAVEALATLHSEPFPRRIDIRRPDLPDHRHDIPDFDRGPMTMEVRLLLDWYFPWTTGRQPTEIERQSYLDIWTGLIDSLASSETNLLLRDFHSPNIIWRPRADGIRKVGILDFQDAMMGPTAYDVASLVQDARVTIPDAMGRRLLDAYVAARSVDRPFDDAGFRSDFSVMAAQRACKLAGLWVRLMQRDGKPAYMQHMPRTLDYLRRALSHERLSPLRDWFSKARIGLSESSAD